MKKFKFRLQTVLEIKIKALDDKMLELAQVMRVLAQETQTKNDLEQRKQLITNSLISIYQQGTNLDLLQIQNYKDYLGKLAVDIKNQEVLVMNIEMAVNKKRLEVAEALKEKKVLELLKENQQNAYYKEIDEKSRNELDDITISRYKIA